MIDSEQVPRGKGEKHPVEGSEIVTETVCLQRAGAFSAQLAACGVTVCLLKNDPVTLSVLLFVSASGTDIQGNRV